MNLLSQLKIRTKLASMVALAALAVFAIIAVTASLSRDRMLEDRIGQIRTAVDMMTGLVVGRLPLFRLAAKSMLLLCWATAGKVMPLPGLTPMTLALFAKFRAMPGSLTWKSDPAGALLPPLLPP